MKRFPIYRQPDQMDCGATCLRMIAKYYGRSISLPKLRHLTETTREGASLKQLSDAAEKIGFRTLGIKIDLDILSNEVPLPCIVHCNQAHFVVVYRIRKGTIYVADPGHGLLTYTAEEFLETWIGTDAENDTREGIAMILEPTPRLQETEPDDIQKQQGFSMLFEYIFRYKKFMIQLMIGLVAGSLLQLIFPFLTQSVVDVGIQNQNLQFIYLVLIAQLFLFVGRTGIEIIRGWILLHLSTRINISLISDFFIKLMNLPIAFFDVKMTGDILQRIGDHKRIENLLTGTSMNVLFSLVNLVIFGLVLIWYDPAIFLIFLGGSSLYFTWVLLFLKKRREWDYKRFAQMSDEQSKVIELINGMQEIKLHNAEKQKRWSWEYLQARLFKIELKSLALEQTQSVGSSFINELKNIIIGIYAAKLVIDGNITLGMMMSISYIIGQLNGPIQQLIGLVYTVQDAKIAMERLSEIHGREDEEPIHSERYRDIPQGAGVTLQGVQFHYPGADQDVLKGLDLYIPAQKTTAIVGASGSGKTTLMKMLLKFYEPTAGKILLGNRPLSAVAQQTWR
ncbi:MAG: cysteine peptidase family C39 domain-containing protein, partial [Bacteroidota bacterium]